MDPNRKRSAADRVDTAGSVAAGTVGSAFGAAKLRDAFAEEHPASHARAVKGFKRQLKTTKLKPAAAKRVGRIVEHGKPGFTPLVVGSAAAGLAAGAGHYSDHIKHQQAKEARRVRDAAARKDEGASSPVAKSAFGVPHPDMIVKKQPDIVGSAKKEKKAAKKAAAQAAAEPAAVAEETPKPVRSKLRAAKASPSMPKAEHIYDEIRGAIKPGGALVRRGPVIAAAAGGLAAGTLIHNQHKKVAKSAFGVRHPDELEKKLSLKNSPYAVPHLVAEPMRRAGKLATKAAKGHGAYLAGAAGVGSVGAVGGVLANRARKKAPAAIERAIDAKFPMPKAGPALAAGAAGVAAAGVLAHERHKKESLHKSAFGVEHQQRDTDAIVLPFKLRKAIPST